MTTPWAISAYPDDSARDADRIGDAWDALVAGHRPLVADHFANDAAELIALAGQLSTEATHGASQLRPTLTFRNHLRETLMHSGTMTMDAALPAPAFHPLPKLGRPVETAAHPRPLASDLAARLRRVGARWAAIAATILLLLASVGGGYLATRGSGGGTPTSVPGYATGPDVTPDTDKAPVDPCDVFGPYAPCGVDRIVGSALVAGSLYPDDVIAGLIAVEMQGWTVEPGATIQLAPDTSPLAGIDIDIVVDGAYAATFDGPVTVSRHRSYDTAFEYPTAGTRVELAAGDAVSYAAGSRLEIVNPLQTRPLVFKSVLLTVPEGTGEAVDSTANESQPSDAVEPANEEATPDTAPPSTDKAVVEVSAVEPAAVDEPVIAAPTVEGAVVTIDGYSKLLLPLDQQPNRELTIYLTYTRLIPEVPFPPDLKSGYVILGPITPGELEGDVKDGSEGFALWTIESAG